MIDTRAVMRSLPLVASVLGKKYGVKVEMGGADAYTDGKTIHLPAMPSEVPDTLLAMVRGFLDHEAGHVRETDFNALQEARLSPIEMHVWNTLEDWRVEHRLAALFPGCRQNFDWLIAHLFGSGDQDEPTEPAANILNWLLLEVRSWDVHELSSKRDTLAGQVDSDFPGVRTIIEPILQEVQAKCVSTQDAIKYAREIVRALDQYANPVSKPEASGQAGPEEQNAPSGSCASSEAKSGGGQNNDEKHTEMGRKSSRHTDIKSESVQSCSPPSGHPQCPMGTDVRGAESQVRNELQRLIRAGEDELPPNLGNILASVLKESSRDSVQSSITVAVQTSKNAGPLSGDDI